MIEALGNRVIIKPDDIEEVTSGGIVIAQTATYLRDEKAATTTGTVVDYGPAAWLDPIMGGKPWVERGARVVYSRYAGKFVIDPDTDEEFVVINDDAIQARIIKTKLEQVTTGEAA